MRCVFPPPLKIMSCPTRSTSSGLPKYCHCYVSRRVRIVVITLFSNMEDNRQAVMPGNKYLGLECLFLPSPVRRPFLVVDTDLAHHYHLRQGSKVAEIGEVGIGQGTGQVRGMHSDTRENSLMTTGKRNGFSRIFNRYTGRYDRPYIGSNSSRHYSGDLVWVVLVYVCVSVDEHDSYDGY